MRVIPILLIVLVSVSFSDTATQTDWYNGGGVPGPVTDWYSSYDVTDQINDSGSSLRLASLEYTVDGDFSGAFSTHAADVDGDGDMDVLGAADFADDITWWENTDGTGTVWTEHMLDSDFDGAHSVYAADVDGDGDTDVLGAADIADDITWWENTDGTGTVWTEHLVDNDFDLAHSVYAADVDGDGDTDVLGAAMLAHDITWWENTDGTGTVWTEHTLDNNFDGASSVHAADVDGDGDIDVLGTAGWGHDISWWENTEGTGTVWTEHTLDHNFNGAVSVYAADVDGDGYMDILGAAYSGEITWWDATCFFVSGALESSILDAGWVDFWEFFASNEEEPAGTSVGFQFRSSDDYTSMGPWSDTVFTANTDLSGILPDLTDFVQYRVILQTTDPTISPVLNDVTISYTTEVSIGDTNLEEITSWDLAPTANPSLGSFTVHVTVPQSGMADFLLYDVTGRVIAQRSQDLSGGEHSVSFNNLQEGVYFCTMRAGDFTATERIVILK